AVLICTCTLVMSGTASIGRRVKFHAPSAATASIASITIQRWRIDRARMRSSRPWPAASRSGAVWRGRLVQVRRGDAAVARRYAVAGQQAEQHLDMLAVARAELDLTRLELIAIAHEDHGLALDRLQRRELDHHVGRLAAQQQAGGDEQAGPQPIV